MTENTVRNEMPECSYQQNLCGWNGLAASGTSSTSRSTTSSSMLPVCTGTVLRTRPSSSYSHSTTTTIDLVVVLVGPATGTHFILPVPWYTF